MDLFKITFAGTNYYYSSSRDNITFKTDTYTPSAITRTEISSELNDSEVKLSSPMDTNPFTLFSTESPALELALEIYDYDSQSLLFSGILSGVETDFNKGTITTSYKRKEAFYDSEVPYRNFGTTCSFSLGDSDCTLDLSGLSVLSTSFSISGSVITVPEITQADGYFTNGFIITSQQERAYILSQVGTTLTIDRPLLYEAASLHVYPGCNKTYETCSTKFSNGINFGGFPDVPLTNPVTESI